MLEVLPVHPNTTTKFLPHECEEGLGMLHRKHEAPGGHADEAVTHATKNFGRIAGVPRSSVIASIIPAMTWAL